MYVKVRVVGKGFILIDIFTIYFSVRIHSARTHIIDVPPTIEYTFYSSLFFAMFVLTLLFPLHRPFLQCNRDITVSVSLSSDLVFRSPMASLFCMSTIAS